MTREEYKQWQKQEQKKLEAIRKAFKEGKDGRDKNSK
jgi:hypothetical protein